MPKPPKGQKMEFDEKPKMKSMEALLAMPPPAPPAASKTDASPAISPRSTPRWGADLPPALDLAAPAEPTAGADGTDPAANDAAEAAEAAGHDGRAAAPDLVAMDPAARAAAVDDVLGRLMAQNMNVDGNKEAAASDLAEIVKAFGVASLWTYGIFVALKAALADSKGAGRCEGGLLGVVALMRRVHHWFEPYVMDLVPIILALHAHKAKPVQEAAAAAGTVTVKGLNPRAARLVLPLLFEAMEATEWRTKQGACILIGVLAKTASSQLNICMPLIVPRVTSCLRDTKKEVAKAAKAALTEACRVSGNPDIAPTIPSMIAAIKNPDDTPKALEELMHTTFIHPVDAASLAVIVPVLARSLVSRGAMHEKRKAATVIINMCKLVLNPSDVEPFVPKLLPELKKSADDAAFEEIRDVCRAAEQTLLRAMGEAGIAVINQNQKDQQTA